MPIKYFSSDISDPGMVENSAELTEQAAQHIRALAPNHQIDVVRTAYNHNGPKTSAIAIHVQNGDELRSLLDKAEKNPGIRKLIKEAKGVVFEPQFSQQETRFTRTHSRLLAVLTPE